MKSVPRKRARRNRKRTRSSKPESQMDSPWEKGIVVGKTTDGRVFFVASRTDTVIGYYSDAKYISNSEAPRPGNQLMSPAKIGDFIEFTYSNVETSEKNTCARKVVRYRSCSPFAHIEMDRRGKNLLIIATPVDIAKEIYPELGIEVNVFKTNFLEKVIDSGYSQKTECFTREQLLNKRLVCKRIVCRADSKEHWAVENLREQSGGNNESADRDLIEESDMKNPSEEHPTIPMTPAKNARRHVYRGIVCSEGNTRNGHDELFVWVPGNPGKRDIIFPRRFRNGVNRESFFGKWVSFSVNERDEIDRDSAVKFLREDVLPTVYRDGRFQFRVPCTWDGLSVGYAMLWSEECGNVIDIEGVLDTCGIRSPFAGEVWVYNRYYDSETKWCLSPAQPRYDRRSQSPVRRENIDYGEEENAPPRKPADQYGTPDLSSRYGVFHDESHPSAVEPRRDRSPPSHQGRKESNHNARLAHETSALPTAQRAIGQLHTLRIQDGHEETIPYTAGFVMPRHAQKKPTRNVSWSDDREEIGSRRSPDYSRDYDGLFHGNEHPHGRDDYRSRSTLQEIDQYPVSTETEYPRGQRREDQRHYPIDSFEHDRVHRQPPGGNGHVGPTGPTSRQPAERSIPAQDPIKTDHPCPALTDRSSHVETVAPNSHQSSTHRQVPTSEAAETAVMFRMRKKIAYKRKMGLTLNPAEAETEAALMQESSESESSRSESPDLDALIDQGNNEPDERDIILAMIREMLASPSVREAMKGYNRKLAEKIIEDLARHHGIQQS